MIFSKELDHEGYIRSSSIESIKKNKYLLKNDKVKIPDDINYFLITDEVTDIVLENGLYAKKIMISDDNLNTSDKTIIGAINEVKNKSHSSTSDKLKTPRNINGVPFDGTKDIVITANPNSHNQSSNTINSMTGYIKHNSGGNIIPTDSLNNAIGKIEKNLDNKLNINDKAKSSETSDTALKLTNARNINLTGNINGNATFDGTSDININTTIVNFPNIDASKITSGTINIERLPVSVLERMITVQNDSARFKLTTSQVQLGDTVKVTSTNKMYLVINESKLNEETGYEVYVAGRAAEVPWSGVTGKPSTMPNPHALTISLNGTSQGAYTGSSAKSINITPSSIGAAASSHGTHVTYAVASPLAAGTASVGTSSKLAREDHRHPLQTSVSGNAGTATKLAIARSINGTNFDGSGNITTATWGTTRTITIGNSGKSVNGDSNVSWSLNDIGAASGYEVSATTAAKANWYRIAQSGNDISNNIGLFLIQVAVSGKHSSTLLSAGISYGTATLNLDQLSHNSYNGADGISKVRIVYHTTYAKNKAYLEVYVPDASARTIKVQMLGGNLGWTLVTPSTAGSVPSGYTYKEITLYDSKIVSYGGFVGNLSGNANTASSLSTARTIILTGDVTGSVSFNGSSNVSMSTTVGNDSHSHSWTNITSKPSSFTPSAHNQSSNTITAMTGYSKPSSTSAISVSDSLNTAIGKIEKALDGKQPSGSYALSNHNHNTVYAAKSHGNHVPTTQTASNKVFLRNDNTWATVTPANIGAANASHTHSYLPTNGGTISGNLTVTGSIVSNGNVTAYSDRKLKTDIKKIDNALGKVKQINGYTFTMLGTGQRQAGVIAQELKDVLPEVVVRNQDNGYLTVMYGNIVSLLIEAIKELSNEVKELKGGRV